MATSGFALALTTPDVWLLGLASSVSHGGSRSLETFCVSCALGIRFNGT
jgi:hypothetical protein